MRSTRRAVPANWTCPLFRAGLECLERRELLSVGGWAIGMGSAADNEWGWQTATDGDGNVYVTGEFGDTVDFDPDPMVEFNLTSQGGSNTFIAKYSPAGALFWARSNDVAGKIAVAVDASDKAAVTFSDGQFWRLNADGTDAWSPQAITATGSVEANDVAVDAGGAIYVTGRLSGTADFGTTASGGTVSLTSSGLHDIFVAKYAASGEAIWAQRAGYSSTGVERGNGITVDGNDVYVTGSFFDGADFGSDTLSLPQAKKGRPKYTSSNIFVAKMDAADGTFQWASAAGGTSLDDAEHVTVDGDGNVYITGNFRSSSATFGGHTINNAGYYDAYAAKLDPAGNFVWVRSIGGVGDDWAWSVLADDVGNLYVAGDIRTSGEIGPFSVSLGSGDLVGYLAKLDTASGDVLGVQQITRDVAGLSIGNDGAVHLAGGLKTDASGYRFSTGETLFSTPLADGSPGWDIFVSKMEPGAPGIRRLSVSPDPITQGSMLTLSAHGVLDIGGRVASVAFYRDTNGDGLLDADDELLGTDTDVSNAWGVTVSTATFPLGSQTYFAVATDNDPVPLTSDAVSATGTVVDQPPASANDIYVADIQFDSRLRGKGGSKHDERIVLTVRNDADANGADGDDPVLAGASVSVTVIDTGSFSATLSGTTDSLGVFTSTWLGNLPDGTYTAEVTSISLGSFVWNASLGTNTATHTIDHPAGASSTSAELTNDSLAALEAVFSSGFQESSRGRRIVDNVKLDLLLSH